MSPNITGEAAFGTSTSLSARKGTSQVLQLEIEALRLCIVSM